VLGLVAGFIIGFMICNNFFYVRSGAAAPTTAATNQPDQAPADADPNEPRALTPEEIKNVIARADAKPDDRELQKNVAFSLYRYASGIKDITILPEVRRLLERANQGNTTDADLMIVVGNVNFDIAQNSDGADFPKAREYYNKALVLRPNDPNVRTDLGLTYFFARPSDPARAIAEYRKSILLDPKHELTLQNLSSALIATGSLDEATKRIAELEAVNPSNPSLSDLHAQLAQKRNAAKP
jgi:tetratricopeptide (TPR) repeat protein